MVGKFDSRRRMDIAGGMLMKTRLGWQPARQFSFDSNLFTVSGQEEAFFYTRTYANNILLVSREQKWLVFRAWGAHEKTL